MGENRATQAPAASLVCLFTQISRCGTACPAADLAVFEHGEPLERERRASAVGDQSFAHGGQTAGHAHAGVEIELQVLDTEARGGLR